MEIEFDFDKARENPGPVIGIPRGTFLNADRQPAKAGEAVCYRVGNVLGKGGWHNSIAIPVKKPYPVASATRTGAIVVEPGEPKAA